MLHRTAIPAICTNLLQDADSVNPEGKKTEGAFYLWSADEVAEALGGGATAQLFAARYGVRAEGNCTLSPRRCACNVLAAHFRSCLNHGELFLFSLHGASVGQECTRTILRTRRLPAALLQDRK